MPSLDNPHPLGKQFRHADGSHVVIAGEPDEHELTYCGRGAPAGWQNIYPVWLVPADRKTPKLTVYADYMLDELLEL